MVKALIVLLMLTALVLYGLLVRAGPGNDNDMALDDEEQEKYLQQWKSKKSRQSDL